MIVITNAYFPEASLVVADSGSPRQQQPDVKASLKQEQISPERRERLKKDRDFLVKNINVPAIIDQLNMAGPLSADTHEQMKLPTKTPRDHTRDYLNDLEKKSTLEYLSFLKVMRDCYLPVYHERKLLIFLSFLSTDVLV